MFFSRRFFPFFLTFFFGAFNDNLFRNALVIMISYQSGYSSGTANALSFTAMALLMLPYFPFSATAGQLADKFPRHKLFRACKIMEFVLMVPVLFAFMCGSIWPLLALLFFMGTQSALFSPLKYAYIPQMLEERELLRGNAYVNAGTYVAVIFGAVIVPLKEVYSGLFRFTEVKTARAEVYSKRAKIGVHFVVNAVDAATIVSVPCACASRLRPRALLCA